MQCIHTTYIIHVVRAVTGGEKDGYSVTLHVLSAFISWERHFWGNDVCNVRKDIHLHTKKANLSYFKSTCTSPPLHDPLRVLSPPTVCRSNEERGKRMQLLLKAN